MNTTKVLIVGIVLAIAAYFVVSSMKGGSSEDKAKAEWFSKLDADKDGKLSPEEVKAMDTDNDGKISRDEAKTYGIPISVFDKLDANKDGFISQEEMKTYGG
jgi:Ca2+-binding EF-hand superfamily protein